MNSFDIELSGESIKKRAISGSIILGTKRVVIQVIQTSATIFLARLLFPEIFGTFIIMVFIIEFFGVLPAQGLINAIIQRKERLKENDAGTIFWILLLISLISIVIIWLGAGLISSFYRGQIENGIFLTRLMSLSIIFINLKAVPAAILERQIKYLPLALIEATESLTNALISVTLAFSGLGILSLMVGYMGSKLVGVFLYYIFGSFRPKFVFIYSNLIKFVNFAFHFQIYSIVNSISGAIAPIYVGRIVGTVGAGYLSWAGGIGLLPWTFAELIGKISFPIFSRIQKDKKLLTVFLERSIEIISMVVMPISIILLFFSEPIVNIVFTSKWLPAVWAFRYFVLFGTVISISVTASSLLTALGKMKFVRNVSFASAVVFWILAFVLVPKIGFSGHPLAWFLGSLLQFIFIFEVKRLIKVSYFRKIFIYLLLASISALPFWFLIRGVGSFLGLISYFSLILVIYFSLTFLFRREQLLFYFKQLNLMIWKDNVET